MDHEHAFAHVREAIRASKTVFQKNVRRQKPKPFRGHVFHRGERRFEYERSRFALFGNVRRGRSSEGPSPNDDLLRIDAFGYEVVERRFGVAVHVAFLGNGTLAHSVSAVVDAENVQSELFERLHGIEVRRDIASIAMEIQHRRTVSPVDEPTREHDAVGSRKINLGIPASGRERIVPFQRKKHQVLLNRVDVRANRRVPYREDRGGLRQRKKPRGHASHHG